MITLSLNLDGIVGSAARSSHAKKVRELVDTHLAFPGSDKLKMGVTVKDNGSSSVTFAGPRDIIEEAKRLWQENVKPATDKFKVAAAKATQSTKATAKKVVKAVKKSKPKKSVMPKKKAVRVTVKAKKATKKKR